MNRMSWADFRRSNIESVKQLLPLMITYLGEDTYYLARLEDVIVVGDLHPRVRATLNAIERRARVGMPPPHNVTVKDAEALEPVLKES